MSASDYLTNGTFSASLFNLNVDGTLLIDGSPLPTPPAPPTSVTYLTTVSGIWTAGPENITVTISLVSGGAGQNLVFATIGGAIDSADNPTYITGPTIPVGFRPLSDLNLPINVLDNDVVIPGNFNVTPGGDTYILPATAMAVFSGAGQSGYSTQTFTWTTNA